MKRLIPILAFMAGCFTVSETDYPAYSPALADARSPAVVLTGFESVETSYIPVYGSSTVWTEHPGFYGRHGRYHPGWTYPETVTTTTYIPRTEITTAYVERAQELLEEAGWDVGLTNATVAIDVKFSGPESPEGAGRKRFLTFLATLFTAETSGEIWSARLRISDLSTGKVLFLERYEERYESVVWGLVPVFGPLAAEGSDSSYIRRRCLSALTDRAVKEATDFLSGRKNDLKGNEK